jgi:hypothetical protein
VFRISAGESPEPKCSYLQSATRTERNEIRSIVYIYFLKIVSYICSIGQSCFFLIFAVFHVLVADKKNTSVNFSGVQQSKIFYVKCAGLKSLI